MKITENIKAPEAFLIERGGQQTDHKAAYSRHSDRASKRMQGSLSLQERHQPPPHQPKQDHPKRDIGNCLSKGRCPFRESGGRLCIQSPSCWSPCQKHHWADVEFGILGRDLQKQGLQTAIELSGLTSSGGFGRWSQCFKQPKFLIETEPWRT